MSHLQSRAGGQARSLVNPHPRTCRLSRLAQSAHRKLYFVSDVNNRLAGLTARASGNDPTTSASNRAVLDKSAGRMTYKPQSYGEMVDDAVEAVAVAIGDGLKWLEVEFPALPTIVDGMLHWFITHRNDQPQLCRCKN
jgi:hypothetical protein